MSFDETNRHRAFALPGASRNYGPDKTVYVEHIDLHLTPDLASHALDGICTTTVRALDEDVASLALDAIDLQVSSVERDGLPQRFTCRDGKLEIAFVPAIAAGERATFAIAYRIAEPRHGLFFVEPTAAYPHKVAHAWTQGQDENARYWFPCLDYPHEKQTSSATIVVRKGLFALSNGELTSREDRGDLTAFRYEQRVPHSTYLMTLVVGPFVEVSSPVAAGAVPVYYYVLPGREADGERAFSNTPRMIEFFERMTGVPYPYARYSQIAVGDFIFGGMENTSATTQTDRTLHDERAHLDFSSDPLVSHELAHQWFGDLLTCRDWAHAWLNEGFATYFDCAWREADLGYDEYLYAIFGCVERYVREDADRYRRPIVCNQFRDPIELFDRHLYEKGAAVLHMLRGDLGDARFRRAIARYVRDNAQRSVETIDLIRAIEVSTGRNMRGFFDRWVFRGGHPELSASVKWDPERKTATVTIDQKQPIDAENPPYALDIDVGFVLEAPTSPAADFSGGPIVGERRVRMRVERDRQTIAVPLGARPALVRIDPGAFALATVTYEYGTEWAVAALRGDPDVVARIRAARELAKDGSLHAREALAWGLSHDPFWGVSAEIAKAIASTHAPWARVLLAEASQHAHPKVRRAVAEGLGSFKHPDAASALLAPARGDASYFVTAQALHSLGQTRDERAFDLLQAALRSESWNGTIAAGAARGLGELADPRATALLIAAAAPGSDEAVRRAAVEGLARLGASVESERTRVVHAIGDLLDDEAFLVRLAAIAAAEDLADARLLAVLERVSLGALDGRARRSADEAAIRIREAQRVPAQVTALRDDLDRLREDQRKMQEEIEKLSQP